MQQPSLTVCIVAKDEESSIGVALASVQDVANEIILVDTGSTDRTVEIAQAFGATVVHYPWTDDFSAARNVGLDHATGDWVLMLDADEALAPGSADTLLTGIRNQDVGGYCHAIVNCRAGARSSRVPIMRLFRNKPHYRFVGRIHEQITPAVESAGDRVLPLDLEIEHYGYTAEEDVRKHRRERNRRLLEEELRADPDHQSAWYFLGLEDIIQTEYGGAADCMNHAVALGTSRTHGIMAAHRLTEIELLRKRIERGWTLAASGAGNLATGRDSAFLLARLASFEGDSALVASQVHSLRQTMSRGFGNYEVTPKVLLNLEASGLWEQGQRSEALTLWEEGLRQDEKDVSLAVTWVKRKVELEGLSAGLLNALRSMRSPAVAAACAGSLLRAGELDEVAKLARERVEIGLTTDPVVYGLAWDGKWDELERVCSNGGLAGAVHLASASVWFDHPATLTRAIERLSGSWQETIKHIVRGEPLPPDLIWVADVLMAQWAELGCLPLLNRAVQCLPGSRSAGEARAAWLLYEAGVEGPALEMALRTSEEPDSAEVLGLIASANGDWEAAAQFLTQRISAGPAPVRVYAKTAAALRMLGNEEIAQTVLAIGRESRPHSLLLGEMSQL